jgi:hypothetical protein
MPLRLGLLVYPLFAIAVAASHGGVVRKFQAEGAVSPETAVKPASLCILDVDAVQAAARRGALLKTDDGRYYVNQAKYRRRTRLFATVVIVGGLALLAVTIISFLPK